MQEKFLVEDIQPGLLDKTSMSDVFVNNTFPEKYLAVANFSDTSNIKLPTIQNLVGTVGGNQTQEKPDFYTNVFKKVDDDLKLKDPTYKNPAYAINTINPENVLPYVQQDTNYSSNLSAAFGQGAKGATVGAVTGAGTGGALTIEFGGLGAIPGSVIGGAIGGASGFLSGLLNTSGKQDFIIGSNNRERTAQEQSGFWNRIGGFTNNVIDRSFEAGLGGTAALLSTPFGALAGKDMYDWGANPLTERLSKGLEESEYKAKLSDNYLSKGPIAKLFTGEGFQNEMADMVGFTVGMIAGTKGLGLLNKGAGLLTAPVAEGLGFEQKALSMASGEGMLGQVLPTLAKQSSSFFTRGTKLAREGAAYDEALMFQGWGKGFSNTIDAFKAEGVTGALSNVGKGFTQFPTKFVNFFKDGTNSLNMLSSFERTALASYGEARVESAQSYKDIYETALLNGYTGTEAASMATEGANKTLGFNMLLLGMTNQFGLNNMLKTRNALPDLAKWLTKDYAFDNSTKLFLKNTLKSVGKNMAEGFVAEGFAEELGQFAIGEASKNYVLDTSSPVYKSFLKEIVNAYTEGITSDEGISNWFGGGLFGAITGMIGLDGGILGSLAERKNAANFQIPTNIRSKMTETNQAVMDIMRHTSAFNGQLYTTYSRDDQGNLVQNNQGNERLVKNPNTLFQLAKALESISTLTKDQVASIVNTTSLEELIKNAAPKEKKSLENGFNGITEYLNHIDSIKESKDGIAQGFIEFVDKLSTNQRNDVMQTLYALKTATLSEKSKSAQDIIKQQLLSNYVYDHVSNGVESKLFDELDLLEKTLEDPNANTQDLEFLGKKYQQGEQQQALADVKQQRKDINRQVNIYRNLQLRYGQPLSYEYLRDKDGNIEKHAITVPLKEVFRSAVRQKQIQESLKESKDTLDKELEKIVGVFGENEVIRQLNKGLSGSLENDVLAKEILKNANVDNETKAILERIKENEDFLNFNLKYENAIFDKLTDAKSIIKNLHNRFKTLQNAIDESAKKKEEEEKLAAQQKAEQERKEAEAKAEAERKAKEQADFEEKQRKDRENGKKEAELEKERLAREAKLKKEQEEKEAKLKKEQELKDIELKKKEKERIVNQLNQLIPDGFDLIVTGIDENNRVTTKTKDGVVKTFTIEEFKNFLKEEENKDKVDLSKMNQNEFAQWIQDNKDYLHSIKKEATSLAGKRITVKPFEDKYYELLTVRPEYRREFIENKGVLPEVDFDEAKEYYKTFQKEEDKYTNSESNPDWIQFNFGNTTNTESDGNRRKGYITISENSINSFKNNIPELVSKLNKALENNYNGSFKITQKLSTLKNQFDNLVIHGANAQEVQIALGIINKTLLENGVSNQISQIGIDGKNKKGVKTSHTRLLEEKIQNNELKPESLLPITSNKTKVEIEIKRQEEGIALLKGMSPSYNVFEDNSSSENVRKAVDYALELLAIDNLTSASNFTLKNTTGAYSKEKIKEDFLFYLITDTSSYDEFIAFFSQNREILDDKNKAYLSVFIDYYNKNLLESKDKVDKYFNSKQYLLDKESGAIYLSAMEKLKDKVNAGFLEPLNIKNADILFKDINEKYKKKLEQTAMSENDAKQVIKFRNKINDTVNVKLTEEEKIKIKTELEKSKKANINTQSDIEAKKTFLQKEKQQALNRITDIENNLLEINNRLNNNLQPELDKLYEKLKNTKDETLKKEINNEIDKLSKTRLTKVDIIALTSQKESLEGQIESAKKFIKNKDAELAALGQQPNIENQSDIEKRRQEELNDKKTIYENSLSKDGKNPDSSILKEDKIFTRDGKITEVGFRKVDKTSDTFFVFKYNDNIDKINAKYDAEYLDAVKKGEMTKEQAMKALEKVGRKDSNVYAELAALEEGGLDGESNIPSYSDFVKDDNLLPELTLENLRRTPGFDNRDKSKTEQELENEIADLRTKEQEELKEAIPDIDSYKVDGIVNEDLLKGKNKTEYNKIYESYDKLITPKLTELNKVKANLHSKALRAFYELTQRAEVGKYEFAAKRAGNLDVNSELYKVWTSQGYKPKPDDIVLVLVDKETRKTSRFNGSIAYNFLPTHSQFYNNDGTLKNDEDLITALLQPKSSGYFAFRFDNTIVDKNQPEEVVREAIRLNYLGILTKGLQERKDFLETIKKAKDGVIVVPIESYKEGVRPKLDRPATLGSLIDKNDKDLVIEKPSKDTKGITRVFYKDEEVTVNRNALDLNDIKYLSELIYDYIKDEIPTNLPESKIAELEQKKKAKRSEIEKLVYHQTIKRNMNALELSNNAISINGKTLYRGPQSSIVIDTQTKKEALNQIENLLSGNGRRAIAYHVNRRLLTSNQPIRINNIDYNSYEDFLKTKVLRVNYDFRINAVYARQAILSYPKTSNSENSLGEEVPNDRPPTISFEPQISEDLFAQRFEIPSSEKDLVKEDYIKELAKSKSTIVTQENLNSIVRFLNSNLFRLEPIEDNNPLKQDREITIAFLKRIGVIKTTKLFEVLDDLYNYKDQLKQELRNQKLAETRESEVTEELDEEDEQKAIELESRAKRKANKNRDRDNKRAITRSESDSYIRENIEEFKTWLQNALPQFPVETSKDVIDGIAEGMFYKNVITLWESAEEGTGFHEAFEGVWNSLLTKEQKAELINEFKQRPGSFKYPFSDEILNYSEASDFQIKETIAEEFRSFMLNRQLANRQPIKNNFFLRLWNYIKDLISSLTNKQIEEISKIDSLFNEISEGKFKYHNTLSTYSEKEYRLIKEGETYDMSNTVLQTIKSKVFEIFSNSNEDILLLNKENKDLYNEKLEQIRQELLNYKTKSAHAKKIKRLYLSEEGFKNYVIPHLSQHLASFKIQVEEVEQDENNRDKEGFVESMFIDSKNLVSGSIKTMVHTLIDRKYDPRSKQYKNRYSIYDYFGDINTFVDGHKVMTILQNVLANTPSRVFKNGVSLDALDIFKIKLEAFKDENGIYPKGYEWIPEFLERVQKNDDLKLAVEKSFVTTRVENSKIYLKNNQIIDLDPVQDETISNQKYKYLDYFRARHNIDNEIETKIPLPNISGKRQKDTFNNLLDFLGIPKDEFNRAKETNPQLYDEYQVNMIDGYLLLKEEKNDTPITLQDIDNFYNVFTGGISSTFKNLLLLNQDPNERQLVYQNADGKKQYSIINNTAWSTLINVLSLVDTKQDLLNTLPHLANKEGTDFKESLKNSKVLNGLFYSRSNEEDKQPYMTYNKGDKKPQGLIDNLKYTLINGVDVDGNEGMVTASLSDVDRVIQQVYYADKKGIYYTMVNSDKSSELAINIGQFLGNHENKTEGEFSEYLWDNYAEDQLKFYNSYLSDKNNTNYDHFSKALKDGNLFWGEVVMTDGLIDIESSKEKVLQNLRVSLNQFLKDFRNDARETDLYDIIEPLDNDKLDRKIVYNTLLSTIEQHLIIYGDTMFYKLKDGILDSPKRTSAYNATKETILQSQTHWNALYNKTMRLVPKDNNGKFKVESFDDIEVMVQPAKLNAMVYDAYLSIKESHNQNLTDEQIGLMLGVDFKFEDGKFVVTNYKTEGFVKAYLEMNEADAQAYILTDFYMDLMYRSGKLSQEEVDSLNWKKAKEIEIRSNLEKENPLYKEYSVMHRYWAKNILEKMPNNNDAVIGVKKPQYSGYSENDTLLVPALLKNSVMPLHFIDLYDEKTGTVRYTKAMKAYINAQNNGTDIIGHKSGQKFGSPVDENGKFVSMFKDGEYTDESPIQQTMYESFMGIQSEIPAKRKFEILGGSQIRKIITQNLKALADSGNHPELVQLLKDYNEIVEARYNIGLTELEEKLGLTYIDNEYVIEDPSKLVDQLTSELNRLNLPDNVKEIIDLNRDRTDLLYKLEGSPNNLSLQSVLLSIVDKSIVHQKVRGKGSPQIASSLFTNETRSTEKVTINGKEKEVMTDSGLGFYYNDEGEVIGMEVLIPNPFYDIYPDLTWEQFEVMMEKDSRLKELAAYRIPTQSLGQFEFIKIKGFYDNSLGDAVIVPSGIVAKAGSDFDIDKLNIYIPHVRLTKDNQLEYIEYLDDSNSTEPERYREFIKNKAFNVIDQLKEEEEYINFSEEYFKPVYEELNNVINSKIDTSTEKKNANTQFKKTMDLITKSTNQKTVGTVINILTNKNRNIYERQGDLQNFINERYSSFNPGTTKETEYKELNVILEEYGLYLSLQNDIKKLAEYLRESIKTRKGYEYFKKYFSEQTKNAVADFIIKNDLSTISQEEFGQLPIPQQNTKKAIENKNIELMNKLASYKTNAFTAMSANNADTLKKLSELYKEKRTDTYLSIGSFMRQINFRQANLSSKSLVGLAAVHVTGHMITQNGNTQLTGKFINNLGFEEDLNIILPMSYDNFLSLDKVWDTKGNLITSNLSEFLSAIVDAAKDSFIFDLNINAETLNTALYLTRLGVSLEDSMKFMSSPIIKKYLKKKRINKSLFKKQLSEVSKGQSLVLIETLNDTAYFDGKNKLSGNNLTKLGKELKNSRIYSDMFFKIGQKGVIYNSQTGLPVINYNTYEENLQYIYDSILEYIGPDNIQNINLDAKDEITKTFILLSYLKYNKQAGYLGNINAATSIDTKAPNTVAISVDLQMKRDSIKKEGFVSNTEDMFTKTFLDNLWKNKELGLQAISNYQIMANSLFQESYLKPALRVLNRDEYLSTAKKDKIINKFQNFLMTYFLQNYDFENGSINYRKNIIKKEVIDNYNEVLKLGEDFKIYKLITKNKVKDNELENIVKLRSNASTSDINEAIEELLEYQEIFKNSEDQEDRYNAQLVNDFLISLTEYSLLQTGFGPSRISFASYLPLQTYTKHLNKAFEDLYNNLADKVQNNTLPQLWKQFIQNNATDNTLVDQIVDNEKGELTQDYMESYDKLNKGRIEKTFNTYDNYPLFVNRTYYDFENGFNRKILYQISNIKEVDKKILIQYREIDILGRGRYFTETEPENLSSDDSLLINIINSNKLEEIAIFESEMAETNPLILAGVLPTNMKGNAKKDIEMASMATQFIGEKAGNARISSTEIYKEAWGDRANTGEYNSEDLIMVSGSGPWRGVTEEQIKEKLSSFYKPLLNKAIKARASFLVGNASGSDILIREYLTKARYNEVIMDGFSKFTLEVQKTNEPKGEMFKEGIYVNQEGLTKDEQLELFDYLKPFLESQGKKTNMGANAPIMIGLELRWDYRRNNSGTEKLYPELGDRVPVNVGTNLAGKNTSYAYYDLSINGKPLGKITPRFIELMTKSTGIDITNYDGAIINLYANGSLIGNHSDLEESETAEKYPVVVANIGGSGNIILGTNANMTKIDLKAGAAYLFGFKGINRKIPHSTYANQIKGFLPTITIAEENKTFNEGSYRISITMRRVMPLEKGMPIEPAIIQSNVNTQETVSNITQETAEQIYPQLGSKTQSESENIVFSNIKTNEGKYNRDANIKAAENNDRIYSMETSSDLSFSNPWASFGRTGTIKTNTTAEAVKNYIDWLTTDKFKEVKPERKEWILTQLKSGELKDKAIQYYAELNEPSHATALDYLINEYNWSTPVTTTQTTISIQPNINRNVQDIINKSNHEEGEYEVALVNGVQTFISLRKMPKVIKKGYSIFYSDYLKLGLVKRAGKKIVVPGFEDINLMLDQKDGVVELSTGLAITTKSLKQTEIIKELEELFRTKNVREVIEKNNKINANEPGVTISKLEESITSPIVNIKETEITYTPKGKATQTYTVRGSKIFNKAGKEVFTTDSTDRNKIFANVAVQEGRAVIVNYQNADYVVNTRNQIISVTTGKQMQWAENNGNRKDILSLALTKFNALNSTTKIPRNNVEGTKNKCLK